MTTENAPIKSNDKLALRLAVARQLNYEFLGMDGEYPMGRDYTGELRCIPDWDDQIKARELEQKLLDDGFLLETEEWATRCMMEAAKRNSDGTIHSVGSNEATKPHATIVLFLRAMGVEVEEVYE